MLRIFQKIQLQNQNLVSAKTPPTPFQPIKYNRGVFRLSLLPHINHIKKPNKGNNTIQIFVKYMLQGIFLVNFLEFPQNCTMCAAARDHDMYLVLS